MTNDEIMREIERLSREVNMLKGSNLANLGGQSVLSGDVQMLGQTSIRIPIIYALSSGSNPTDADANGVFLNAFGETWDDGTNLYQLGGVNNGTLQFGLKSTDGAAYFSGGQGTIDSNGINMNGIMYALRHYAEDPTGTVKRYGRFEMLYPDGKTIPALSLTFTDAAAGTNLILNGDFETGDFTNWTAAGYYTAVTSYGGSYRAYLTSELVAESSITSDSMSVTGGSQYSFYYGYGWGVGSENRIIQVLWYDAGYALVKTDTLKSSTSMPSTFQATCTAPSSATSCKILIKVTYVGAPSHFTYIDDITFTQVQVVRKLLFTPDLEYMDGSDYRRVLSAKKELYAPQAPTIALVSTASGNCTNGAHLCKVTFTDSSGETEASAASNSVTVDASHKQITCTLEVGPWGTTSRNIYMTEAGGTTYKLVGTQADNTTTSYTIDVADASLTTDAPAVNLSGSRYLFPTSAFITSAQINSSNATLSSGADVEFAHRYTSNANANNGDWFIFDGIALKSGTYTVNIRSYKTNGRGIFDFYLDNVSIITGLDCYSASAGLANDTYTGITITGDGIHELKIVCNGKNGSSSDYGMMIYSLAFARTGA